MKPPAPNPCGSCPYHRDVPSGIWHREEYEKLPPYDAETAMQPPGVFMCHQQDGKVCAGWCGTHDMRESLAIRFAASNGTPAETIDAIRSYKTETPLFASGREAYRHGIEGIWNPSPKTASMIATLKRKRSLAQGTRPRPAAGKA